MKILLICNTDGAMYMFRKPILTKLVELGHAVISLTDNGKYVPKLSALGVKTRTISVERHTTSLWSNLQLIANLYRIVGEEAPQVVHNFTHKPAIFGTIAASLNRVPKIFITITGLGTLFVHNNLRTRVLRFALLVQYRIACRLATAVFFQNPDDLSYFVSSHIIARKKAILTHGSGVDLTEVPLPSSSEIDQVREMIGQEVGYSLNGRKLILFAARAIPEKGFFEFYETARIINSQCSDYIFLHLGLVDGESTSSIHSGNINTHASRCGVHYLGFKDNVLDYMVGADVVVLPSAYREGVPRSLIEALALGKCIVTTDTPGCRETVREGWNGFFCRIGDVQSLVQALLRVDSEFIHACRERSRSYCEEKFDADWLVRLTLELYFKGRE